MAVQVKEATVAVILRNRNSEVLLGYKIGGEIGAGTVNAPGGRVEEEEGESVFECVVRETEEETRIRLRRRHLRLVAVITFYAGGIPYQKVHFLRTNKFGGKAGKTRTFAPHWYNVARIPFGKMLKADRYWFALVVKGERFFANVYYQEKARGFVRMELFPGLR